MFKLVFMSNLEEGSILTLWKNALKAKCLSFPPVLKCSMLLWMCEYEYSLKTLHVMLSVHQVTKENLVTRREILCTVTK